MEVHELDLPVASENLCMSPQPVSQFGDLSVSVTFFQAI
jgi:hypothetical protein